MHDNDIEKYKRLRNHVVDNDWSISSQVRILMVLRVNYANPKFLYLAYAIVPHNFENPKVEMGWKKKTMGKGATVSCQTRYLHPSEHIRNRHPNPTSNHRTSGLIVIRKERKYINRKVQLALVLNHDDYKNFDGSLIELYATQRWLKIESEGPEEYFYEAPASTVTVERAPTITEEGDNEINYKNELYNS